VPTRSFCLCDGSRSIERSEPAGWRDANSDRGGTAGAATAAAAGLCPGDGSPREGEARAVTGGRRIETICHQGPSRCGIDVQVTNRPLHASHGKTDPSLADGKLLATGRS